MLNDYENDEFYIWKCATETGAEYKLLRETEKSYVVELPNTGRSRYIPKNDVKAIWHEDFPEPKPKRGTHIRESQLPKPEPEPIATINYGLVIVFEDHSTEFANLGSYPFTISQVSAIVHRMIEQEGEFLNVGPCSFKKNIIRNTRVYVRKHH